MKIGFPPNYYVQVFPDSWDQDPEVAELYEGIITLSLNLVLPVRFVPDVSASAPPWRPDLLDDDSPAFTTPRQAREYQVLTSAFSVTPNPALAGQVEAVGDNLVFYVTPEEFTTYQEELDKLTDIASDSVPTVRRDDLLDRAVIRFVDGTVLREPRVLARRGTAVGRGPRADLDQKSEQ